MENKMNNMNNENVTRAKYGSLSMSLWWNNWSKFHTVKYKNAGHNYSEFFKGSTENN